MELKDIYGNVLKQDASSIYVESLGVSLEEAIDKHLIEVPDDVLESLNEMQEKVAIAVGTISSVVVEVDTDATGTPHAEGTYADGVLAITLYNIKGDKGDQGEQGEGGKSAYDIAVEGGYEGTETEWLASLKGADGLPGADGKDGIDGKDGKDGKDGTITNLAQSVSASDTTHATSGKAVADYVKANGGTKLVQGSNVTLETLSDGSVKISASLTPGTATDAKQIAYTNGQTTTSGGTVADKLTELDGKVGDDYLNGKKWCPIGDSFTAGDFKNGTETETTFPDGKYQGKNKVYPYLISLRTGINILYKFFNGGRTLAYPSNPGTFINSTCYPDGGGYYQKIPVDVDYVTIYLGINDKSHGNGSSEYGEETIGYIPLGDINDNVTSSYYGAYNTVISWIMENRPNAKIGIIISNGTNAEYHAAQLAIAKKWGIPYIDMNGDQHTPCMISSTNTNICDAAKTIINNKWMVNPNNPNKNSHPNVSAHLYESYFIENFLRSL